MRATRKKNNFCLGARTVSRWLETPFSGHLKAVKGITTVFSKAQINLHPSAEGLLTPCDLMPSPGVMPLEGQRGLGNSRKPSDVDDSNVLDAPLLGHSGSSRSQDLSEELLAMKRSITAAVQWSLIVNVVLLIVKVIALWVTGSMAVAASALDSLVDLASQGIVGLADVKMARPSPKYPAGRARLEPIAVLGCAYVMTIGAIEVVRESAVQLHEGLSGGDLPHVDMTLPMYAILGAATLSKLILYFYCIQLRAYSGAALALAEDHINDVASNIVAIATAAAATSRPETLWWADPAGGIVISLYIITAWSRITVNQIRKIVGETAPDELLAQIRRLAEQHYPSCHVAFLRAYYAGQRLKVDAEMEATNPGMTVREASRVALSLKKVLESIPEVESAAVAVVAHPSRVLSEVCTPAPWVDPLALSGGLYPSSEPTRGSGGTQNRSRFMYHDSYAFGESEGAAGVVGGGEDSSLDEETGGVAGSRRVSFDVPGGNDAGQEGRRVIRQSPRQQVPAQRTGGSLLGQLLWSRSLRDPPENALRSARMVGYGTASP